MDESIASLREDGLASIQRALDRLEGEPIRIDWARRWDGPSSPPCSWDSGTTTRPPTPELSSHELLEQQRKEEEYTRRQKPLRDRLASIPRAQFRAQVDQETDRILNANPCTDPTELIYRGGREEIQAIYMVRNRWVEQGIWKDTWDEMSNDWGLDTKYWKREDLLELESESETRNVTEVQFEPVELFGVPQKLLQLKPRRPNSDDEKRHIAERQVVLERERQASRPYHQFVYQVSKERERIQDEMRSGEDADVDIAGYQYQGLRACQGHLDQTRDMEGKLGYIAWDVVET